MGRKLTEEQLAEALRCHGDERYFIETYCRIIGDGDTGGWMPFDLWPEQARALEEIIDNRLVLILKARQLGLTWLVLAFILHRLLFHPIQSVLLFSLRQTEASAMLDERLKGMYRHLPEWMQTGDDTPVAQRGKDNTIQWSLPNGSITRAFPANRGDSYTGTVVMVDEADLIDNLGKLLRSAKPTIDAGGRLIMLSRSNKEKPLSRFKREIRSALKGRSSYHLIFLPWYARPSRTRTWYNQLCAEVKERDGVLDEVHEQYPETIEEALQAKQLDKRIAAVLVEKILERDAPIDDQEVREAVEEFNRRRDEDDYDPIALPIGSSGFRSPLRVYRLPQGGRKYAIGADVAEGNPTSDDSALIVLDAESWEQVAVFNDRVDIDDYARIIDALGEFYNRASVLVERNNHGHACIMKLQDISYVDLMRGGDDKVGWATTEKSKVQMYTKLVDAIKSGDLLLHDEETAAQIVSINGSTLRAPEGMHDDISVATCLAVIAASQQGMGILL